MSDFIVQHKKVKPMGKNRAWSYAFGMIKVDGLEPTEDFLELVEKEKCGEITKADIKRVLDNKYALSGNPSKWV